MQPEEFKRIRISVLKLTQVELSFKLGVSGDSVSRFERGIIPIDVRTNYALKWLCHISKNDDQLVSKINAPDPKLPTPKPLNESPAEMRKRIHLSMGIVPPPSLKSKVKKKKKKRKK